MQHVRADISRATRDDTGMLRMREGEGVESRLAECAAGGAQRIMRTLGKDGVRAKKATALARRVSRFPLK